MELLDGAADYLVPAMDADTSWRELLRSAQLSVGTYCIRAGGVDDQEPHNEDEVYVVVSGRARFTAGGATLDVGAGSTIFVPAREEHRFHDITADLTVVVMFAPAEGTGPSA
jgi:mannose-6-phosphate isomerase-like protein (cupin superfamily)